MGPRVVKIIRGPISSLEQSKEFQEGGSPSILGRLFISGVGSILGRFLKVWQGIGFHPYTGWKTEGANGCESPFLPLYMGVGPHPRAPSGPSGAPPDHRLRTPGPLDPRRTSGPRLRPAPTRDATPDRTPSGPSIGRLPGPPKRPSRYSVITPRATLRSPTGSAPSAPVLSRRAIDPRTNRQIDSKKC